MELAKNNPWWALSQAQKSDKSTQAKMDEIQRLFNDDKEFKIWKESKVKWDPQIRGTFNLNRDIVYSLRGPRQVGKTTLFKLEIKKLLEDGISPHNILYYDFEYETIDPVSIITSYLADTKKQRGNNRTFLFLDEINAIKNWQSAIKLLVDNSTLNNCTILVTGSHLIDIKLGSETMFGRRGISGDILDKIMWPMSFAEFISVTDDTLNKFLIESKLFTKTKKLCSFIKLQNGIIDDVFYDLDKHLSKLEDHILKYLLVGGTPMIVNEYVRTGEINREIYQLYTKRLLHDVLKPDTNLNELLQLIRNIITATKWGYSWDGLKKHTTIENNKTIANYIDILQRAFVLSVTYQYNLESNIRMPDKEKKINFSDPFYYHSWNAEGFNDGPFKLAESVVSNPSKCDNLLEGVISDHLHRFAYDLNPPKQLFDYNNLTSTWRYDSNKEVDFIFHHERYPLLPIELKYRNSLNSSDYCGLNEFKNQADVKNAILLSKRDLKSEDGCVTIPASMFLLLV